MVLSIPATVTLGSGATYHFQPLHPLPGNNTFGAIRVPRLRPEHDAVKALRTRTESSRNRDRGTRRLHFADQEVPMAQGQIGLVLHLIGTAAHGIPSEVELAVGLHYGLNDRWRQPGDAHADRVVLRVGHEDTAVAIHGNALRQIEQGVAIGAVGIA